MAATRPGDADRTSSLLARVDRLLPDAIRNEAANGRTDGLQRARLVLVVVVVGGLIGLLLGLNHLAHGNTPRAVFTMSAIVPFMLSLVVLRWSGRVEPAAHYLCALCTFFVIGSPFLARDSVPLMVGLIAVPLAATVMGGARVGLVWTGIVLVLLVGAAEVLPFSQGERDVAWNIVTLTIGCGIALATTEFLRDRAMREAALERERAEDQTRIQARTQKALAESQALFATAFRRAPSALVLSVAATSEILDVNEGFERIFGYRRQEVSGRKFVELDLWPTPASRHAFVRKVLETGSLDGEEVSMRTRTGEQIWLLLSGETLDVDGRTCILVQGIDISDRKRLDEELERRREEMELRFAERGEQLKASQAELRERERLAAVGTLAAGIAHQINNPIGGIMAATEFALMTRAEEDPDAEEVYRQALQTALEEARRCGRIVKSVLKFARDEPTPKWVEDLNPTVHRACELARTYVEKTGGELTIGLAREPLPVQISSIDIEQVVLNLVRNAAESKPGGATVHVATRRAEPEVEILVEDDGHGIEAGIRSKVLDPFYTTRLEDGGFGLGLSVAHGVVSDHGGSLEIESVESGGTRVRVRLPIADMSAGVVI